MYNQCTTQYDGYLVHELPAFFHHLPVDHCGLLGLRRLLVRLKRVLHQSDQTGAPPRVPGHFFSARWRDSPRGYGCQSRATTDAISLKNLHPACLQQRGRFHMQIRPERNKKDPAVNTEGASLANQLHPRNRSEGFRRRTNSEHRRHVGGLLTDS